ncbi:hypothetical protein PTMSG1_09960 [Pyrenophora teres f. maculata]|nr:hypothetical protein PTMSG1_09960 [Pyrenophora teres f. maculata]
MERLEYENHTFLPSDAPQGQPHIIKDGQEDKEVFYQSYYRQIKPAGLCDFVATVLYRLQRHPTAMQDFFDPAVKSFKFLRMEKKDSWLMSSMIWRIRDEVLVGHYNRFGDKFEWELLSRSKISKIAPDGLWRTEWGAQTASSNAPMNNIWQPHGLQQVNFPLFTTKDPNDALEAEDVAYKFGTSCYFKQPWKDFRDAKCVIKIKKMSKEQQEKQKEAEGSTEDHKEEKNEILGKDGKTQGRNEVK